MLDRNVDTDDEVRPAGGTRFVRSAIRRAPSATRRLSTNEVFTSPLTSATRSGSSTGTACRPPRPSDPRSRVHEGWDDPPMWNVSCHFDCTLRSRRGVRPDPSAGWRPCSPEPRPARTRRSIPRSEGRRGWWCMLRCARHRPGLSRRTGSSKRVRPHRLQPIRAIEGESRGISLSPGFRPLV